MRLARTLVGVLLLAVASAGCDTTQPEIVGSQIAEVTMRATNSTVLMFDVWDGFEDSDDNNVPDGPLFTWCETIPAIPCL